MSRNARFWNVIAKQYAKSPVKNEQAYAHKLGILQRYLSGDRKLLEIGCGTGTTALKLSGFVQSVLATDISPAMIDIAEGKKKAQAIETVSFEVMDVKAALNHVADHHVVMAMSLLHLIPDRKQVIQDVYDRLPAGGLFVSSTACIQGHFLLLRAALKFGSWLGLLPAVHALHPDQLKAEMTGAGFEILETFQPSPSEALFLICRKPIA